MAAYFRFFVVSFLSIVVTAIVGCGDNSETIRSIQTQRHNRIQSQAKHDHLGELFQLLEGFNDLNPEKASRQITYHLNQWLQDRPLVDESSTPALLETINDVIPSNELVQRIRQPEFVKSDVNHLRDSYLFRRIVQWIDAPCSDDLLLKPWLDDQQQQLGDEQGVKLRAAARLFDWTIRNVALEPVVPLNPAPPLPIELPLGMKFRGPGYRQTDFESVWRGTGDYLQRAGVFTLLCRQVGVPAFVLSIPSADTGTLQPWCVGVLIGSEIYLFDTALGTYIPGPDQTGIATLTQARRDESVLRRMNVPGFFDYPYDHTDVAQCTALLNVLPEAVSARMKHLESGLTGERRMFVYVDTEKLASEIDAVSGIAGVRLWKVPLLAEVYRVMMQTAAQRDPMFNGWYFSLWAVLEAPVEMSQLLARGRWRQLTGVFDTDEVSSVEGARPLLLIQRKPEFDISKLNFDVELQKKYGIRREKGVDSQVYQQQIQQAQILMRYGKSTATYWLSLIQYDDQLYETAENWFLKRVVDKEYMARWEPPARYALARTYEQLGKTEQAIELYKTDGDPQEHGNRIRARLLSRSEESP